MQISINVNSVVRDVKLHSLLSKWTTKEELFTNVMKFYFQCEWGFRCLDPEPSNPKFITSEVSKYIVSLSSDKHKQAYETMLLRTLNIWLLKIQARFSLLLSRDARKELIKCRGAYTHIDYDPKTNLLTITTRESLWKLLEPSPQETE